MSPRILVVEDDPDIAAIVVDYLRHAGYTVEHQAEGRAALASLITTPPDLTLLDIMLPGMDGLEILRQPRRYTLHPVIMLTARVEEVDRLIGLELGADDYIAKPFSPRELVARVRTILRRSARASSVVSEEKTAPALVRPAQPAINSEALVQGTLALDEERRMIRYHGQALELSRYEYGLLAALMQRPGRVFTRDELLERVWDDPGESFDRTVDAHIKTLRAKLRAVRDDEDPIRTLRGVGYALRDG